MLKNLFVHSRNCKPQLLGTFRRGVHEQLVGILGNDERLLHPRLCVTHLVTTVNLVTPATLHSNVTHLVTTVNYMYIILATARSVKPCDVRVST